MIPKIPPRLTNRASYIKYLETDLWSWLRELTVLLTKINFQDNFQSFTVNDVSIPAKTEVRIANQFKNRFPGQIPTGRMIIRQVGDANIIDGDQAWTADNLYLKNPSSNNAVVSVLFFR
jgi:hypothetical protein